MEATSRSHLAVVGLDLLLQQNVSVREPPVVERLSPFAELHRLLPGRLVNGWVNAILC